MTPRHIATGFGVLVGLCVGLCGLPAGTAHAQDDERRPHGLGLPPGVPQVSSLPGGLAPVGAAEDGTVPAGFDFHGYLTMPLNIGINEREGPTTEDQFETVLHTPPRVPEARDRFTHTGAVPEPYVQLNFSYGSGDVQANVILQARSASVASSFFDASTRGSISGAYVTFKKPRLLDKRMDLEAHVGAFTTRYGVMGEHDEGRYGTPLLGRVNGVGENVITRWRLGGDLTLEVQQALQGLGDTAPLGVAPGDWNEYADPAVGTSLAHHYHLGLAWRGMVTFGLHYLHAFTADERANQGTTPDGSLTLMGADLRITAGRYGHFYVAGALTDLEHARSVGRVVEILNAPGGASLMEHYLGPASGGNGSLTTAGAQYDISLARALAGARYQGTTPDIVLSVFGIMAQVESDDAEFDGRTKLKYGAEGGYSLLSWLAASARVDHVAQDLDDNDESFTLVSGRIIFRSDWQARDQVTLQYSHWFNGDQVYVESGSPATIDPTISPDEHLVSLSASMWW